MQTYCIKKSDYIDEPLIHVSTDELGDKINAVYVQNHDNLQLVNNMKLMEKSKIFISSSIKNAKEKCHSNNFDVPFSTWKVAADELIVPCNIFL